MEGKGYVPIRSKKGVEETLLIFSPTKPSKIGDSSSKGLLAKQEEAKVGSDSTEVCSSG